MDFVLTVQFLELLADDSTLSLAKFAPSFIESVRHRVNCVHHKLHLLFLSVAVGFVDAQIGRAELAKALAGGGCLRARGRLGGVAAGQVGRVAFGATLKLA